MSHNETPQTPEGNPFFNIPVEPQMQAQAKAMQDAKLAADKLELEYQRLCYEIFHMNPDGKKLHEMNLNHYIVPRRSDPTATNAEQMNFYWEGFKDALRGQYNLGLVHKQRIAGVNG